MPFADNFMARLFQNSKFPYAEHKGSPSAIFSLLKDLAMSLVDKVKLKQESSSMEFYTLCLLNCLFGDPRIHLCWLHPQWKGPNFSQAFEKMDQDYQDVRSDFVVQK